MSIRLNDSIVVNEGFDDCCAGKVDNVLDNGYIFVGQGVSWDQLGNDIDGETSGDAEGSNIALNEDGTIIATGAPFNGPNAGQVRVFKYNGNDWVQLGTDIETGGPNRRAGRVDINAAGDRVVIGIPLISAGPGNSGALKVFEYDGNDWVQLGNTMPGTRSQGKLGTTVTMNYAGDVVFGGEANQQVYCFEFDGVNWNPRGNGLRDTGFFGFDISISCDNSGVQCAVGDPTNDEGGTDAGKVYLYEWFGDEWFQRGEFNLVGENPGDALGTTVKLSGNSRFCAVGAPLNDSGATDTGHVRVFEYVQGSNIWQQLGSDIDGQQGDERFGQSVSMSDDGQRIIAGSTLYDSVTGVDSGSIRMYDFNGVDWIQVGTEISGENPADEFGYRVDMNDSGEVIASASIINDGGGTGPNTGHVRVYQYSGDNQALGVPMSGDVTITNSGVTTVVSASDTVEGKVELADAAETEAGISDVLAVTPAGGDATYVKKSDLTLENLVTGTQVLALSFSKTNDDASEDTWIDSGLTMTVPKAGTYELYVRPTARIFPPVAPLTEPLPLMVRLYDTTNNAEVAETKVTVACYAESSDVSISGYVDAAFSKAIITTTGATSYRLEILYSSPLANVTYNLTSELAGDNEGESRTYIGYRQLPGNTLSSSTAFTGSTVSSAGEQGLVPKPQINDEFGVLIGNGEWSTKVSEAVVVPSGNTAERPPAPLAGMIRFNFDISAFEVYDGTSWETLATV